MIIDVLDRDEFCWLLAHLALNLVEFGKEALLRAKNHVKTLAINSVNLCAMIEDFTARVLGDLDFFDLVLE